MISSIQVLFSGIAKSPLIGYLGNDEWMTALLLIIITSFIVCLNKGNMGEKWEKEKGEIHFPLLNITWGKGRQWNLYDSFLVLS